MIERHHDVISRLFAVKPVPKSLIPESDSEWAVSVDEYLEYLPLPNRGVSLTELVLHGSQLLEGELDRCLCQSGMKVGSLRFVDKIDAMRRTSNDPERTSLWEALDLFRELRNTYAHSMKKQDLKSDRAATFIRYTEEFLELDGAKIYPEEQRVALGIHVGITLVWESLLKFRGAPSDFSIVRPTLEELFRAISNLVGRTRKS